ncbi:MAG: response regulator [Bradymonadia bacterium]
MSAVLLVDDEPHILTGLRNLLRNKPYHILTAHSGEAALAILEQEEVDVVITDERMPGMSGSELCAQMSTLDHPAVRIILTGQASLESAVRALNEGCVYRFLHKPCKPAALERTLNEALQLKSMSSATVQMLEAVYSSYQQSMPMGFALRYKPNPGAFTGARAPAFVSQALAQSEAEAQEVEAAVPGLADLSMRERELVQMLTEGYRLPQIAEQMGISHHTARNHLKSVFAKTGIHSQGELVAALRR